MSRLLMLCAALGLAGCSASATVTPTTPTSVTPANQIVGLESFTQGDLANAIGLAKAAGPNGTEIVTCFSFLQTQLAALQAQNTTTPPTVGLATAFTVADLALANVTDTLGSATQSGYETSCGPLVLHVTNQGLTLTSEISALAATLAK